MVSGSIKDFQSPREPANRIRQWALLERSNRAGGASAEAKQVRDTDKDWNLIASEQPYYGVLSADRFRLENLNDKNRQEFFRSGEDDIARTAAVFQGAFGEFRPRVALDFGCGVGRLLLPMASRVERAYGVDVAAAMRKVAVENVAAQKLDNVVVTSEIPDVALDWVNSLLVLQHIPPVRGYALLAQLWERLNPGGFLSLQVTLYHDLSSIRSITDDMATATYDGETVRIHAQATNLEAGRMSMYDYDLNRLIALFDQRDGQRMVLEHTNHGGCRGAKILVRKN